MPPGFTITTEACNAYMAAGDVMPDGLMDEVAEARAALEGKMGKQLGDPDRPAARVGALGCRVLDAGDDGHRPQPRAERRLGRRARAADRATSASPGTRTAGSCRCSARSCSTSTARSSSTRSTELRDAQGVATDPELSAEALQELVDRFKAIVLAETGIEFPQDPQEQLRHAIEAVFRSWNGDRARIYRREEKIPDDLGTAVNVQTMVFGNKGDDSGTGVAFTRDPATGENRPYGDFLANAQGEDVVAGIRATEPLDAMANDFPESHAQLLGMMDLLEQHYRDMCDIEFTVEQGRLFMLQVRVGKRTAAAALRIAVDMEDEGLIDEREAVLRIAPDQLDQLLHPQFDPDGEVRRDHEGPQRVAGRGGRQGLLHARRRRGAPRRRRSRDPRAARDVARRHPRHDRGRGHPHVARRAGEPRGAGGARLGQAGGVRRARARHRHRRWQLHA